MSTHLAQPLQGALGSPSGHEPRSREELSRGAMVPGFMLRCRWVLGHSGPHQGSGSVGHLSRGLRGESSPNQSSQFPSWLSPYIFLLSSCLLEPFSGMGHLATSSWLEKTFRKLLILGRSQVSPCHRVSSVFHPPSDPKSCPSHFTSGSCLPSDGIPVHQPQSQLGGRQCVRLPQEASRAQDAGLPQEAAGAGQCPVSSEGLSS